MIAVTLETLRADFEAQRQQKLEAIAAQHETTPDKVRTAWIFMDADVAAKLSPDQLVRLPDAMKGAVYVIARDYGLEAAMLFKLSGGNIDPRVSA